MKLEFFDGPLSASARPPLFSRISAFKTAGVVMNVFLLDPSQRLLSAFVWLSSSNTIGLYVLLDWEKAEYVFIDTGIEGVRLLFFVIGYSFRLTRAWIGDVVKLVVHSIRKKHRDTL